VKVTGVVAMVALLLVLMLMPVVLVAVVVCVLKLQLPPHVRVYDQVHVQVLMPKLMRTAVMQVMEVEGACRWWQHVWELVTQVAVL